MDLHIATSLTAAIILSLNLPFNTILKTLEIFP